MVRRAFVGVVAGVFFTMAFVVEAQRPGNVARIGYIVLNSADSTRRLLAALREGLRERGWVDGANIVIEDSGRPPPWARRRSDPHQSRCHRYEIILAAY